MEIILHDEYICSKTFLWTKLHTITTLILFSASLFFIISLFEHSINLNSFSNSSGCWIVASKKMQQRSFFKLIFCKTEEKGFPSSKSESMKEMCSNSIFAFGLSLKRSNSLSIDLLKNLLLTTTTHLIESASSVVAFVSRCKTIGVDDSASWVDREQSRGDIRGEDDEEGADEEEEEEEEDEDEDEKTERGGWSGDWIP